MDTDLLYRVTREDEAKLIALLTECFTNDPLYQELIPDEEKREKLLPELFRCDLDEMFEDCEIYANNENLEKTIDTLKKKINPQADKLVAICKALDMSLVDLLCNGDEKEEKVVQTDYMLDERQIVEVFRMADNETKRRLLRYFELVEICNQINENNISKKNKRNVSVIQDIDGNNIVVINDIIFKGKRSINWKDVREYLKNYIGDFYTIASTGDIVYIGLDLPNEYSGSKYTHSIKGTNAKAKANAAQGIPELIEIAVGKHFRENTEAKHWRNAKFGWYRYDSRFALPVYDEVGEIERYNVFHTSLIVRHSEDKKLYLYDILDIKKETSNPIEP